MDEQEREVEYIHRDAEAYALKLSDEGPWPEPDPRKMRVALESVVKDAAFGMGKAAGGWHGSKR